jgi:ABC-type multidrug transport system ATPase subunit
MTTTPAVLVGLTKRYGSVTAVDDLNLTINAGEVVALLGPNGAGKSTTIDMMLGLTQPDRGDVRLYGKPPCGRDPGRRGRRDVAVRWTAAGSDGPRDRLAGSLAAPAPAPDR